MERHVALLELMRASPTSTPTALNAKLSAVENALSTAELTTAGWAAAGRSAWQASLAAVSANDVQRFLLHTASLQVLELAITILLANIFPLMHSHRMMRW